MTSHKGGQARPLSWGDIRTVSLLANVTLLLYFALPTLFAREVLHIKVKVKKPKSLAKEYFSGTLVCSIGTICGLVPGGGCAVFVVSRHGCSPAGAIDVEVVGRQACCFALRTVVGVMPWCFCLGPDVWDVRRYAARCLSRCSSIAAWPHMHKAGQAADQPGLPTVTSKKSSSRPVS